MKEEKRRKRGFQAGATLDHDARALQVDTWRGSGGKQPRGSPKRWRGRQERIHCPASACPARRASYRSRRGSGGGGGAAPSPPPEGSTDNESWAEKIRAEKANLAPNSVTPPARCRASPGRGSPGTGAQRAVRRGSALPRLQAAAEWAVAGPSGENPLPRG